MDKNDETAKTKSPLTRRVVPLVVIAGVVGSLTYYVSLKMGVPVERALVFTLILMSTIGLVVGAWHTWVFWEGKRTRP